MLNVEISVSVLLCMNVATNSTHWNNFRRRPVFLFYWPRPPSTLILSHTAYRHRLTCEPIMLTNAFLNDNQLVYWPSKVDKEASGSLILRFLAGSVGSMLSDRATPLDVSGTGVRTYSRAQYVLDPTRERIKAPLHIRELGLMCIVRI